MDLKPKKKKASLKGKEIPKGRYQHLKITPFFWFPPASPLQEEAQKEEPKKIFSELDNTGKGKSV